MSRTARRAGHCASGVSRRPHCRRQAGPSEGRQWLVNSLGLTLLKINPGVFVRKANTPEAKVQTVQLTRPFFLSDREITVGQFQQFISHASYPDERNQRNGQAPTRQSVQRLIAPFNRSTGTTPCSSATG